VRGRAPTRPSRADPGPNRGRKKTGPEAMKLIVMALQKNKNVSYADVLAKAEE
jgi:hypothetical protein